MQKKGRLLWLDAIRGLLLILITLGHFDASGTAIYPMLTPTAMYYVPLFFFISGFMTNPEKYSYEEFTKRKAKTLLLPYVFFVIVFTVLDWKLLSSPTDVLKNNLFSLLTGDGVRLAPPLWFVSCLFVATLATYGILRIVKDKLILVGVVVLLSLFALPIARLDLWLPWRILFMPMTLVFTVAGYLTNDIMRRFSSYWLYVILLGVGIAGMFLNLGDYHFNQIDNYPLFFVCPISFGISILFFASKLENRWTSLIAGFLGWISRNGIVVLSVHFYLSLLYSALEGIFTDGWGGGTKRQHALAVSNSLRIYRDVLHRGSFDKLCVLQIYRSQKSELER